MISLQSIAHFANNYLQIYSGIDCVEIVFFIFTTFKISSWLNKDHTKPLLLYFYSYFTTLFSAYYFQLTTVYQLMLVTAPIYFVLLIVHHQKNLQKNFIISKNKALTPAKSIHKEWLETLIRACLVASHHRKNITCVIEQFDCLETLIDKPFILDIPIQKQIIDILLESVSYDNTKLITVDRHGTILSINASWSDLVINELIFTQIHERQLPKEYAKVITSKTDAILVHINSEHQHHFVAHQGKIIENVTIDQALKLIKNLLHKKDNESSLSQGINHDPSKSASFTSFYKD
jgi:DNA integrity scanning protein DisA with diadenylate cyclase activity